jgi:hypothetical protein
MDLYQKTKQNPMYLYLIILTISSTVGLQVWRTLFNNFAVEVAGLDGNHVGMIQSVREIPGFLALLAIYAILVIKEHRLSALSILVLGIGVAITGLFPAYTGLLLTTLLMSFGFHYYETTNMSLTLQYFDKGTSPWVFGKQRSFFIELHPDLSIIGMPYHRGGDLGLYAGSNRSRRNPATQKNDFTKTILAFLFPHVYGRCTASDLYGICRIVAGSKISVFGSGNHRTLCN